MFENFLEECSQTPNSPGGCSIPPRSFGMSVLSHEYDPRVATYWKKRKHCATVFIAYYLKANFFSKFNTLTLKTK